MRTISLPARDRTVSLLAYVQAIRTAKAHPAAEFTTGLTTWWPTTGAEILGQFRRGLHEQINESIPSLQRGVGQRKGEMPLQLHFAFDARSLVPLATLEAHGDRFDYVGPLAIPRLPRCLGLWEREPRAIEEVTLPCGHPVSAGEWDAAGQRCCEACGEGAT